MLQTPLPQPTSSETNYMFLILLAGPALIMSLISPFFTFQKKESKGFRTNEEIKKVLYFNAAILWSPLEFIFINLRAAAADQQERNPL